MNEQQIRTALGHQVKIEAGVEHASGELTEARKATVEVGAWGGESLEIPNGNWILTIDGSTREWSDSAVLTVLD